MFSYKHVSASGLLTLRFTREEGETVLHCPASATQLGGQRLLEDRYEAAMTRLGPSHIPGAEDGLFARVAVPPGTLLSFYHGLNVPYGCDYSQELYAFDEVNTESKLHGECRAESVLVSGKEAAAQRVQDPYRQ